MIVGACVCPGLSRITAGQCQDSFQVKLILTALIGDGAQRQHRACAQRKTHTLESITPRHTIRSAAVCMRMNVRNRLVWWCRHRLITGCVCVCVCVCVCD